MEEIRRARERAAEFRALAETFVDPRSRQVILDAAEELERIAAERERRLTAAPRKADKPLN